MTENKHAYAGIGSRKTPLEILQVMEKLAIYYAQQGHTLRSGNCEGADQAFQKGANSVDSKLVELFLPYRNYGKKNICGGNQLFYDKNYLSEAFSIANRHHLAWHKCSKMGRIFHARNVQMILGHNLGKPVRQVICWTPDGKEIGGTAMGIAVARENRIAVLNLANEGDLLECTNIFQ